MSEAETLRLIDARAIARKTAGRITAILACMVVIGLVGQIATTTLLLNQRHQLDNAARERQASVDRAAAAVAELDRRVEDLRARMARIEDLLERHSRLQARPEATSAPVRHVAPSAPRARPGPTPAPAPRRPAEPRKPTPTARPAPPAPTPRPDVGGSTQRYLRDLGCALLAQCEEGPR